MNFKTTVVAAALLAASVAASAATPINLQDQGGNIWSGVFEGNAASNLFSLDLSTFASVIAVEGAVSANVTFGSGYNVTSVLFDGQSLYTADINTSKKDQWSLDLGSVTPTLHTIQVDGFSLNGGKFTASVGVQVTAVPEPETYALMLAGLAAVGFVARRRQA
nr:FxDxF family PEP-CTERM protein [uncultured Roseateles sp.]